MCQHIGSLRQKFTSSASMWFTILYLSFLINIANSEFVVEVNKLFKTCANPKKAAPFPLDLSNLQVYLREDEKLVMNGEIKFTQNINPPWGVSIYTHKLDHGEWLPTPYSKHSFNLCIAMHASTEMWYAVTKHMNQTNCPFKKGHVEKFDMVDLGNFGFDDVLADLVGDWRIFLDFSLGPVPHQMKVSCIMNEISILEH
uniref:MD-2-related lipid-recognition domain-containing protein n=1 Tax=Anopheles funestus TaxID=62324 RepID=A0A182R3Y7_ANOFN